MSEFYIGQIFSGEYPPEAAYFCNESGNSYITELEPKDGVRQFQIVAIPEPTEEEIKAQLQAQYTNYIQSILDAEAKKLGYDSCLSVCSYANTGISKFDCEGDAFRVWRSAVWNTGYQILDAVKAGTMEVPSEEELIELLPKLTITYSE